MKNTLETLEKIQRVKTPPFLFTRIEARIKAINEEVFSFKTIAGFAFTVLLLLFLNITTLKVTNNTTQAKTSEIELVIQSFELNKNNQLYYD